ncbi:translation factor Sua5 [Actibacterium mucosum KCTC 23349]|uniref:Threonylcarbamoyl-AMP synthase n=1 Tax=Actibacterium mucosum KCTC 23349 TaxID=1454373 RepID=A0A037ZKF4_9RHOB|nr:L-threonylcarbamoyladenylate synthase [Actibacterium mucosum]KAJ56124.1 translation factor Sua5 [Actibacterium mucosum KCTC 23349]
MTATKNTQVFGTDAAGIKGAAAVLRAGGLVAFPTETVYGLGADACDGRAVAGVYAAKGRPTFNPLIAHVADLNQALALAEFDDRARALATAFWPGPLTMVLPRKPGSGLSDLVTAGLDTVALRVPSHPVAQALLVAFGGPVAAPSANPSGRVSPTRADHVLAGLSGHIDGVVDGGACAVGVESTIIGLSDTPTLLRPGGVPVEAIEACLGAPLSRDTTPQKVQAPGQLASHYAPQAMVRLNRDTRDPAALWLGFGPACAGAERNLSPAGDLHEAAANLFTYLRDMDELAAQGQIIDIAPIPAHGLGLAINDRLARAAAPRR